jgi:hypothetical protein
MLGFAPLFQPFQVSEILRPSDSTLVFDQGSSGQNTYCLARESHGQALAPCFIELHGINCSEDVNAQGCNADLEYEPRVTIDRLR